MFFKKSKPFDICEWMRDHKGKRVRWARWEYVPTGRFSRNGETYEIECRQVSGGPCEGRLEWLELRFVSEIEECECQQS